MVEALAAAGVGVTLNTNGWFVDEEIASRLGALRGVTAHVSVDGARAGLHDSSRGVPGSWRRAIEGIDHLLSAGVGVCAVHVVTPGNADAVGDFLEQMWTLGVPWVRMTPVVVNGAAARGGEWKVSREALRRTAEEFEERRGTAMRITVQAATGGTLSLQGRAAPGSFLVRPNGDVRPDSLRPFTFGNAVRDGVAACWAALREGWDDERINRWAGAMKKPEDLPKSDLVAYLDDEVPVAGDLQAGGPSGPPGGTGEVQAGRGRRPFQRRAVAIHPAGATRRCRRRRHRNQSTPPRSFWKLRRRCGAWPRRGGTGTRHCAGAAASGSASCGSPADGSYLRLNESGGVVMDALDGGTLADAAGALRARYGIDDERAREDAVAATRDLQKRGVVMAASATSSFPAEPGTTDLPGLEPSG